jgi:lysylphosphatidylglycerol synthetase-like protein (DUF2156 family)
MSGTGPTAPASRVSSARLAWGLMALSAAGIALLSVPAYVTLDEGLSRIPLNPSFPTHLLWLSLHGVPGGLALLLGPLQFLPGLRRRHPALHRIGGRVYLASVLIGSATGAVAAVMSTSGLAAQSGFLLLSAAWFYSGVRGYVTARARRFGEHRTWMIRNYALTFAAVLLRAFLAAGVAYREVDASLTFDELYTASVWCSIFVSATLAEWFIVPSRRSRLPGADRGAA